jgi:protein involved in polysaccharide export with SLBB domain/beta-lactamase regulating signal transducer with metallopeptidase domain
MSALNVLLNAIPSASAVGNHLWQSTLFVGACWIAAGLLRHNRAAVRHSIWMAASLKFLFPLSVLVGIGAYLGESTDIRVIPQEWSVASSVIEPVNAVEQTVVAQSPILPQHRTDPVSWRTILLIAWLSGAAAVAFLGLLRWQHLSARIGRTRTLNQGREFAVLRKIQSRSGLSKRIRLASSPSSIEPGVRGIVRPVLFLPAGITERLSDDQLETIIAHELCHIRRRDNLAAVFHVIVQTLFWFHPLVWWIGSRLVDERERACDEEVVRMGSDPQVYASAILRVCEFYLAAPLAVVSRVTGSNLKTRIEDIMAQRILQQIGPGRKLSLAFAAVAFIATPILFGMTTPKSTAAVASQSSRPVTPAQARPVTVSPQARPVLTAPVTPSPTKTLRKVSLQDPPAAQRIETDYRVRLGDELDVVVWKDPELSRRSVVRPDGKIGIPLVGDVAAEGRTPSELQSEIQAELTQFKVNPRVTVIVATARTAQVTIQGAIGRTGAYPLEGRTTVLQLIAQAGGLLPFAKRDQIGVYRKENGTVRRYVFNYATYLTGANLDQDILLEEGDIVIIP